MKTRGLSAKERARTTDPRDWRGTRTSKQRPMAAAQVHYSEPTICDGCGSVFARKTWRRGRPVSHSMLAKAEWAKCPACRQNSTESGLGRLVVHGADHVNTATLSRRIRNVAGRAATRQPQHRIVSVEARDGVLDLLTSSQQLTHRIVHELKKVFGGRARYRWSDADGSLFATWHAPRVAAKSQ